MAYFLRQKNEERTAAFAEETRPALLLLLWNTFPGLFFSIHDFFSKRARMPRPQI